MVDQSQCHSLLTDKEKRRLINKSDTKRHEAAVSIALKYTFLLDLHKSIFFGGNIRSNGTSPMADIE